MVLVDMYHLSLPMPTEEQQQKQKQRKQCHQQQRPLHLHGTTLFNPLFFLSPPSRPFCVPLLS